jgi:subtilisin family serine protease
MTQRLVVLIDACHSGGAGSFKVADDLHVPDLGFSEKSLARLAQGTGRVIIASSRASETSLVLGGAKHSLSFSSPVVTGVAALVWSYYPELTATQLKEVLLESANVLNRRVVQPNTISNKKTKVKFSELSVTGGIVNAYNAIKLADKKLQGISKNVN